MINIVEKGWGREFILVNNEKYCFKRLVFDLEGATTSMHFHALKDETFFVERGSFKLELVNTKNGLVYSVPLEEGEHMRIEPLLPHRLVALQDDSVMMEVSTHDDPSDSYRVSPGDSQK